MNTQETQNSKKNLLSELYAIRAGLSLVSQCKDVVVRYREKMAQFDAEIQEAVSKNKQKRATIEH